MCKHMYQQTVVVAITLNTNYRGRVAHFWLLGLLVLFALAFAFVFALPPCLFAALPT